jgi:uncharacterized repeat protein (TIGR03803 family)
MKSCPARLTLGLACFVLSPGPVLAGFTLSTVSSLTAQVGASPYGLASDGQGHFIGSTQDITLGANSYNATGFSFDPGTGNVTKQNNPGISTWLPDGHGDYYTTQGNGGVANTGYLVSYNPTTRDTQLLAPFPTAGIASTANNDLMFDGLGHIIGTSAYGGTSGSGTIFSYDLTAQKITILANFNGANGLVINGHLVSDGQGHLFGTTYLGGTANEGTVFRFDVATGTLTDLASFTGVNGALPSAALVSDGRGGFLGTTGFGGTSGDGTVFRVDATTGLVTTISNFFGYNGLRPISALVADGQGGFLGSTVTGTTTATYNGTIFDVDPTTGALTMVGNFVGSSQTVPIPGANGSGPYSTIVGDGLGNFYGTTGSGGTNNLGTIFELTASAIVPEPASAVLLGLGGLGAILTARCWRG